MMKPTKAWAVVDGDGALVLVKTTLAHAEENLCAGERIAPVLIREVVQKPKPVKRPKAKRPIKSSRTA